MLLVPAVSSPIHTAGTAVSHAQTPATLPPAGGSFLNLLQKDPSQLDHVVKVGPGQKDAQKAGRSFAGCGGPSLSGWGTDGLVVTESHVRSRDLRQEMVTKFHWLPLLCPMPHLFMFLVSKHRPKRSSVTPDYAISQTLADTVGESLLESQLCLLMTWVQWNTPGGAASGLND